MTSLTATFDGKLEELLADRGELIDRALVERAFRFGAQAHRGQKRLSGD